MKLKLWPWGAVGAALLFFAFSARRASASPASGIARTGGTGSLAPLGGAFPFGPDGSTVVTPTGVLIPPPPKTKFELKQEERAAKAEEQRSRDSRVGIEMGFEPGYYNRPPVYEGKGRTAIRGDSGLGSFRRPKRQGPGGPA